MAKIRHVEIEATAEELENSPFLADLFASLAHPGWLEHEEAQLLDDQEAEFPELGDPDVPGVAQEGQSAVRAQLASNEAGDYFRRFLAETSTWPKVAVHGIKPKGSKSGAPLDYTRYLRIRRTGSQLGGFAYVRPVDGNVNLRLTFESDEELHRVAPTAWRPTTGHREYRVSIRITDQETLERALQLARSAYERT